MYERRPGVSSNIVDSTILDGLRRTGTLRRRIDEQEGMELDAPSMDGVSASSTVTPQEGGDVYPDLRKIAGAALVQNEEPSINQVGAVPQQDAPMDREGSIQNLAKALQSLNLSSQGQQQTMNLAGMQAPDQEVSEGNIPYLHAGLTFPQTPVDAQRREQSLYDLSNIPGTPQNLDKLSQTAPSSEGETMLPYVHDGYSVNQSMGEMVPGVSASPQAERQAIQEAVEREMPMNGAAEMAAEMPQVKTTFEELMGAPLDDQLVAKLGAYERAVAEGIGQLDEEAQSIRDRLENNQLSTTDKILLGAAVLLPSLIAGVSGLGWGGAAQALLGSLEGAARGVAGEESKREQDQQRLTDLGLKRTELAASVADYQKKLKDALPKDEYREIMRNRELKEVTDPQTGKTQIGLTVPGNDFLVYDINNIQQGKGAEKDIEEMRKKNKEAVEVTQYMEDSGEAVAKLLDVVDQIIEKGEENPRVLQRIFATAGLDNWFAPTVLVNGRKMNGKVAIQSLIENILTTYLPSKDMTRITDNVAVHFKRMLENPYEKKFNNMTLGDFRNQLLLMRDIMSREAVNDLTALGYLRQPLIKKFRGDYDRLTRQSDQRIAEPERQQALEANYRKNLYE